MTNRSHGGSPRGLANIPRVVSYEGRFGRMFQHLEPAYDPAIPSDHQALQELAVSIRGRFDDAAGDNTD